jgi:hypothetical protein
LRSAQLTNARSFGNIDRRRARQAAAWRIADSTNAVFSGSEHSHPGISPANAAVANAV